MPRLTCGIMAVNSDHCLKNALASVVGYVDHVVISIDEKSAPMTIIPDASEFRSNGGTRATSIAIAVTKLIDGTPADGFSGAYNKVREVAGGDWQLLLDADETIDPKHAAALYAICERGDILGVDCWGLPRWPWWDLERTSFRNEWFPDHQWRLMKPHVKYHWRVHPGVEHARHMAHVHHDELALNHFNLVYRDEAAWEKTNKLYDHYLRLDYADGRPR